MKVAGAVSVENEGSGSSQCHEGLSVFVHGKNMINQGMQEVQID